MELKIKKEAAKRIYADSKTPDSLKEILVETFGEECFKKTNWKDLKSFDDLCQACGTTEIEFEEKWRSIPVDSQTVSFQRMKILSDAINQGWEPDHFNTKQNKWFPWFKVSSSGFGFSYSHFYCAYSAASVGSRLCFESEEKSDHAGSQFTNLFQEFITGKRV
jgi:hypothetical protein